MPRRNRRDIDSYRARKKSFYNDDIFEEENIKEAFKILFNGQRLTIAGHLIKNFIHKNGKLKNNLPAEVPWAIEFLSKYINWSDFFKPTTHHIIPSSRFKKYKKRYIFEDLNDSRNPDNPSNLMIMPYLIHWNYHVLFGNRKPDEISDFLKAQTKRFLYKKSKLIAWFIIFGDIELNDEPMIRHIIKNDWMKKEEIEEERRKEK